MRLSVLLIIGPLGLGGCGSGSGNGLPSAPSVNVPFSTTDLRVGSGVQPVEGSPLTVNYTGWLYDTNATENKGQQFDTGQGFTFTLGIGQVIAGWDQGFAGMQVGGLRRIIIPPDLGYGSQGSGNVIPPNATLVFDVELVSVP